MTVVIISPYKDDQGNYNEDRIEFNNVIQINFEYQKENAKSFWLHLTFRTGSKEAKLFQPYEATSIEIEPKKDEFYISESDFN